MIEILTLVSRTYEDDGRTIKEDIRRDVFCRLASIGQSEFYQAQATELRPELKFVLADYLDYNNEFLCVHNAVWYRIIRTYCTGQEIELVVQRAAAEEVGAIE